MSRILACPECGEDRIIRSHSEGHVCRSCARFEDQRRARVKACEPVVRQLQDMVDRLYALMRRADRTSSRGWSMRQLDHPDKVGADLARLEQHIAALAEQIMLDRAGWV